MLRAWIRSTGCRLAAVVLLAGLLGCNSSSRTVIRTYEYGDDGQAPTRTSEQELDSEYQMQSPGQMVSPGTMVVDPDGG